MSKLHRWLALALSVVMCTTLVLPAQAVDPLAENFATLLINAEKTDFPSQTLRVELFRQTAGKGFSSDDSIAYVCDLNRVAGEAAFLIQPKTDGVWVEVEYLTDLNGDGIYEMLDGENSPVHDSMSPSSQLTPFNGSNHTLTKGQTYILSAQTLVARGTAQQSARNTAGNPHALPGAGGALPRTDSVLYYITLHYQSVADKQEYTLGYFIRVFDEVIMHSDVPADAWFYSAAEFVLKNGYLTGADSDRFAPGGVVTRAQLAQTLWRLGGSLQGQASTFSDVPTTQWYYKAASWCAQEGLMSGTGTTFLPDASLTREQLALSLHNYAKFAGLSVTSQSSLSRFSDASRASTWATEALEWAVSHNLLSGYEDGTLRPNSSISRAELSAVLLNFSTTMMKAA